MYWYNSWRKTSTAFNYLLEAANYEMDLKFISREMYAQKTTDEFLDRSKKNFPDIILFLKEAQEKKEKKAQAKYWNMQMGRNIRI
jgi:hypothetical protein